MYKILKGEGILEEGLTRCKWCLEICSSFRDLFSVREYTISLLCQHCQDFVFGKREEKRPPRHYDRIDTGRKKGEKN